MLTSIERNDREGVASLLAAGAPVEGSAARRLRSRHEPTPLLAAVQSGSREIVELLLDYGADPNHETATWMSPLALACQLGDRPIVTLLLERGADLHGTRSRHATPIETASWYGHEALVAMLLEQGADPDRVLSRGAGSLVRVSPGILARLLAAGGHASPEIRAMVEREMTPTDSGDPEHPSFRQEGEPRHG